MPDIARLPAARQLYAAARTARKRYSRSTFPPTMPWARLQPGHVALDETADALLGPVLIPAILNAGYNFDFIDDRAIATIGIPYKVLILPGIERIPLATMQALRGYVSERRSADRHAFAAFSCTWFARREDRYGAHCKSSLMSSLRRVRRTRALSRMIRVFRHFPGAAACRPISPPETLRPRSALTHRRLANGEIYFVANLSNHALDTDASVSHRWIAARMVGCFQRPNSGCAFSI